jgi:hypothetical protein
MEIVITKEQCDLCREDLIKLLGRPTTVTMFKNSIDLMLEPYKTGMPKDSEQYKYDKGALTKYFDFTEEEINRLLGIRLVYDDEGNWHPVNKLNTNYSDLAIFITDILQRKHCLCEVYRDLNNGDKSILNRLINAIEQNPTKMFETFLKGKYESYITNNRRNTIVGDKTEIYAIEKMTEFGYNLVYHASEGSSIDTKLGVDMIFEKDGEIFKVQVKTVGTIKEVDETPCDKSSEGLNKQRGGFYIFKKNPIRYISAYTDLLIFIKDKNFLCLRKYQPISVESLNPLICNNVPVNEFPVNNDYIDHESVVHKYIQPNRNENNYNRKYS